ncbi:MAG: SGNH/GDSL hydrolase family protein [Desulfobacteraceae bacterium]|nr:SGNH/GDSL hydrolase family protein [Desulfobacteraceae bacterium]
MMKKLYVVGLLLLCLVLPFSTPAFAAGYSRIISFGDSLSDNGDADGFGFGVSSNGKVWVDYLAGSLGVGLLDLAYGGARSNYHPAAEPNGFPPETYGFDWQINTYLGNNGGKAESDALYTLWIGGNDLLNGDSAQDAVNFIGSGIDKLAGAGAENILVMNMPDLGATPLMNGEYDGLTIDSTVFVNNPSGGKLLAADYNNRLDATLAGYRNNQGLNLFEVDIFAMMAEFLEDDVYDDEIHMLSLAIHNGTYVEGDDYLFWDAIHPTTLAHGIIADEVLNVVAPVPVPSAIFLLGSGIIGLVGINRRIK